jgi:quinol monooxygenase YgiN
MAVPAATCRPVGGQFRQASDACSYERTHPVNLVQRSGDPVSVVPMIVVTGRANVPFIHREAFVALATEMCAASRQDDGCIGYRVYADLEQPDEYVFIEEWADDDALQRHFAQPHTTRFMAALPDVLGGAPDALFHSVESTRRLVPGTGLVDV